MKYKTDFEFGDTVYMKDDPNQQQHTLIAVVLKPSYKKADPPTPKFVLSYCGSVTEVYDFEVTRERGEVQKDPEETDDGEE